MARARSAVVLAGVVLATACAVDDLDLEGKTCPCVTGYTCVAATNTCRAEASNDGGRTDASVRRDAGTSPDASAPRDGGRIDGSGPRDGGERDATATDAGEPDAGTPDAGGTTTITLPILVDTYVDSAMQPVSFAASPVLLVDTDPVAYETYVAADASPIPAGSEVVSATLQLHCSDIGADVDVHAVTATWTDTITWLSRPAHESTVATTFTPVLGLVEVDLTALVAGWVAGAPNHGLVLLTAGTDGSDYASSEALTASERPRLVVEYR